MRLGTNFVTISLKESGFRYIFFFKFLEIHFKISNKTDYP